MPAPYSLDLREKVIDVYKTEEITQIELAERFNISLSSVKRYIRLSEISDDLSPKTEGKGRPGKIDESGYELIKQLIEERPTITLQDLSKVFYKKKKIVVGRSILSRACQKLLLKSKKLSRYADEQNRSDVKKNGKSIGKK